MLGPKWKITTNDKFQTDPPSKIFYFSLIPKGSFWFCCIVFKYSFFKGQQQPQQNKNMSLKKKVFPQKNLPAAWENFL